MPAVPIRDSYEPGRPCWVDLAASDPAAAHSFYVEMFGWEVDVDPRPEAGGYGLFRHEGHAVAGVGPLPAEGMPSMWSTYIATADVDVTADVIVASGGTMHQRPLEVLDAGRMAVFSGPDGAVAALWEPQQHAGAAFINEPGGWTWNQLMTRDKESAVAFYKEVFDWRLVSHPDWGEYLALGEDSQEVAGISEMGDDFPPEAPPHWGVAFMVRDADAFVTEAQASGAEALGPVQDMAWDGRVATMTDPQGAMFTVMSFPRPFN
jgi:predicted enzyme related to lactoylglutathione lyase